MFDVYGRQNLFTFAEVKKHADRKKLLAHAYSKSVILSPAAPAKPLIERNAKAFLKLIEQERDADAGEASTDSLQTSHDRVVLEKTTRCSCNHGVGGEVEGVATESELCKEMSKEKQPKDLAYRV